MLKRRIAEIVEKFPKLSGLTGIQPYNLVVIRTEKQLTEKEETLGNFIKSKDGIQFELELREVWLEVDMTMSSEDECLKIAFELKVQTDFFISHVIIGY